MPRLTLAATALMLAAGFALAQTNAPTNPTSPNPTPANPAPSGATQGSFPAKYQGARAARLSLQQAIDAAEAQGGGGGRAVDADFDTAERDEPAHYEIKVLHADGRLVEHSVNADTGQVYKSENQPIERYFTRLSVEDLRAARTSLKQAIAAAEARAGAGARAVEAEIEREGSTVAYEIDVATPDRARKFKVSADGQVTGGE